MLQIKHKHHLDFPHLTFSVSPMQFSGATLDDNELAQEIDEQTVARDDSWELSERPDMGELTQFWEEVTTDVANDPKWFRFEND